MASLLQDDRTEASPARALETPFLLLPNNPLRRMRLWGQYALAAGLVATSAAIRQVFDAYLDPAPFVVLFPAVLAAAALLNPGVGYFAAVLSAAVAAILFVPPKGAIPEPHQFISVGLYLGIACLAAWLINRLRAAYADVHKLQARQAHLLQEMNHRTKNNIQLLSSLLLLQSAEVEDERARKAFRDAVNRMAVIGRIHTALYSTGRVASVDVKAFVDELCQALQQSFVGARPVAIRTDAAAAVEVDLDLAIPLGLIVNEAVTNALKHAFADTAGGTIAVTVQQRPDGSIELCVRDDGVGLPPGDSGMGLGGKLVPLLSSQIGAKLFVESQPGAGTALRVVVPAAAGR